MTSARRFEEATFFVKFNNNAVDILFGLIIHRIVGLGADVNISLVTPLLLHSPSVEEEIDGVLKLKSAIRASTTTL